MHPQGGCIPKNVFNGFAIIGPTYQGIGPSVRLGTPTFRGKAAMEEPYDPQTGGPYDQWNRRVPFQTWVWTITVSGLTKGQKYTRAWAGLGCVWAAGWRGCGGAAARRETGGRRHPSMRRACNPAGAPAPCPTL